MGVGQFINLHLFPLSLGDLGYCGSQNSHLDDGFIPVSLFTMPSLGLHVVSLVASYAKCWSVWEYGYGIDLTSN